MISLTLEPPAELDVKRSYATSAMIEPDVDCDHDHVDCRFNRSATHRQPKHKFDDE